MSDWMAVRVKIRDLYLTGYSRNQISRMLSIRHELIQKEIELLWTTIPSSKEIHQVGARDLRRADFELKKQAAERKKLETLMTYV